jgi:Fic family protein
MNQEAVLSSRIEGTQATLGDVLEYEAGAGSSTTERDGDVQEVINYRSALHHAISTMKELPLSQRVIKETHRVLMKGVRGETKDPGNYRRVPVWIGPAGNDATTARFEPPNSADVPNLMSVWEKYIHSPAPDVLVQLALVHAEFEAIHPFLDGNGRIGRLLIPLFLVYKNVLSSPNFYISAFLESNRDEYYDRLRAVSRDGDWTGWCDFFLDALKEQAHDNERKANAILQLYDMRKQWIQERVKSKYSVKALDWFFKRPIFKAADFAASAEIPSATANRILNSAREADLLRDLRPSRGRRSAILCFPELLNIAEGQQVF